MNYLNSQGSIDDALDAIANDDVVVPTAGINARIWIYENGGPIKLTLRPGQVLQWSHYGRDEEGYSHTHYVWTWTGTVLCETMDFDGRDCDGRTSRHGKYFTTPDQFKAREPYIPCDDQRLNYAGVRFPEWKELSRRQRDYAAEAAGY